MTYETYQQMDKNSREREDQLYSLFENKNSAADLEHAHKSVASFVYRVFAQL